MKIEGIEINGDTIANAIRKYYPDYIKLVETQQLFNYVLIFGIRVDTCDTGLPDEVRKNHTTRLRTQSKSPAPHPVLFFSYYDTIHLF